MDLSNLNCPQRVDFNSEEFVGNYSYEDSLNLTVHSNEEGYGTNDDVLETVEPEEGTICSSMQSNMEPQEIDDTCNESTYASFESDESKENFSVRKPTNYARNTKSQVLKATVPKAFHFQTDKRIKSKPENNVEYKEENFESKLRQNIVSKTKTQRVTKVQPFHFTEGKKRKHVEEYKTMAEQVAAFQKTPERFHGSSKAFQPQEHWEPPPLAAKTPQLQAVKRRRVVDALSKEEQEEKEVQEMKSHVFHARPLNPKIYNSSKTKAKIGTKASAQANRKKHQFKARPVPTDILNGPTGLGEKKVKPPTAPKSPAFEVESRLEKRKLLEDKKSQEASTKDQLQQKVKKPDSGPPPITVPWTKRCTSVQPFSFDKNDQERFLHKEKKIQEIIESEVKGHVFHAQLLPSQSQAPLPSVPKKPITVPEPFNFHLESRNSSHRSLMQSMTEEKEHFKAQPATVLVKKPFIPKPCPKQETEIQEFNLHTEKRACEKEQLRQLKEAEEQEKEKALRLLKAQEEERERMELQKLRSELVHKANPIRQYKPIEIKPSSVPLTKPESPSFEVEKRLQSRH